MAKLSLMTAYAIRRLLRKYQSQLKPVIADGAGLIANPEADLNKVLETLYLDEDTLNRQINKIETLMAMHPKLIKDARTKEQIETEILWIFGLERI